MSISSKTEPAGALRIAVASTWDQPAADRPPLTSRRLAQRMLVVASLAGGTWLVGTAMTSASAAAAPISPVVPASAGAPSAKSLSTPVGAQIGVAHGVSAHGVSTHGVSTHSAGPSASNRVTAVVLTSKNYAVASVAMTVNRAAVTIAAPLGSVPASVYATAEPVIGVVQTTTDTVDSIVRAATPFAFANSLITHENWLTTENLLRDGLSWPGISGPHGRSFGGSPGPRAGLAHSIAAPAASWLPPQPTVPAPLLPASPSSPATTMLASTGFAVGDCSPGARAAALSFSAACAFDDDAFIASPLFDAPSFSPD